MALMKTPRIQEPEFKNFTLPGVESGDFQRKPNTAEYAPQVISDKRGRPVEQLSPADYRFLAEWHDVRLPSAAELQYLMTADPSIFTHAGNVTMEFNITDLVKPHNQPIKTVRVKGRDKDDRRKVKWYENKVSLWSVQEGEGEGRSQIGEIWLPIDEYTPYVNMHPVLGVPDGFVEDLLAPRDMTFLLYNPFAIGGEHPERLTIGYQGFHDPNTFVLYVIHPDAKYQGNGSRFMRGPRPLTFYNSRPARAERIA